MTNTTPAQATRNHFIEITRTNGSYAAGTVVYNRGGVIKYRNAEGNGERWIRHADIAEITIY